MKLKKLIKKEQELVEEINRLVKDIDKNKEKIKKLNLKRTKVFLKNLIKRDYVLDRDVKVDDIGGERRLEIKLVRKLK